MINFNTDKLTILYYPPFAGGRFITNCLALSKHAVHQEKFLAYLDINFDNDNNQEAIYFELSKRYLMYAGADWPNFDDFLNDEITNNKFVNEELLHPKTQILKYIFNVAGLIDKKEIDYYDFKLNSSLWSLPTDTSQMKNWLSYEFSCHLLFGHTDISSINYNEEFVVKPLSHGKKHFFVAAHNIDQLTRIKIKWPNAQIIEFINFLKFQKIAATLKHGMINAITPINVNYRIDMDSIFNKTEFISNLKKLYESLKFNDFNDARVEYFYTKYAKLHNITL